MSPFTAELPFRAPACLNTAKAGILAVSLISGIVGYSYIRYFSPKP